MSAALELFSSGFFLRALAAGILIGALASYYSAFVVQRGLSFLGDGLAHAAFGGVALGLFLNQEPLAVAIPFTVLVAIAITWVKSRTALGSDTAIGILFSVSVAFGIILISLKRQVTADAFAYLFGSILTVKEGDLAIAGALFVVALLTRRLWGRWAYASFDRELALADRVPASRDDYVLSVSIALTVAISVKIVGIVLIAAFLVIPGAAARLLARSFRAMTLISCAVGAGSAVLGLSGSALLDLPSGATIILVQALVFFAALALTRARCGFQRS